MSLLPYLILPSQLKHKAEYDAISVTGMDLLKFKRFFNSFEKDLNGSVEISNAMWALGLGENKFMRRLFDLIMKDDDYFLNFQEFVIVLWNFCSLSEDNLAMFAFNLYDTNHNGIMSCDEASSMLTDLYGEYFFKSKVGQSLNKEIERLKSSEGVAISFWCEFCHTHPTVLAIAKTRQRVMRDKVLGYKRWISIMMTRTVLTGGKFMNLKDLLDIVARITEKRRKTYTNKTIFGLLESEESKLKLKFKPTPAARNNKTRVGVERQAAVGQTVTADDDDDGASASASVSFTTLLANTRTRSRRGSSASSSKSSTCAVAVAEAEAAAEDTHHTYSNE